MTSNIKLFGGTVGQKTVSVEQFFDYLEQQAGDADAKDSFGKVAWVFRAVNLRAGAISSIPFKIMKGDEEYEGWPLAINLRRLLRYAEIDLCLSGAAYWLKQGSLVKLKGIQRLNPWSVSIKSNETEGVVGFKQELQESEPKQFERDEVVYFDFLYDPDDDLGPGIAPGHVAATPSQLVENMNTWASRFFEHGAIPAVILESEGTIRPDEQERLRGLWNRMVGGVEKAWKTLILQKGLKANIIGSPVKDLAMPELETFTKRQISTAYGVPLAMLEENAANRATAEIHQISFYTETVIPEADLMQASINAQLMEPLGLEFEFQFDQLEAIQKREAEKAQSVTMMLQEVREAVSTGLLEGWEGRRYLDELMAQMQMPVLGEIERPPDWEEEGEPEPPMLPPQFQPGGNGNEPPSEEESKKVPAPAGGRGEPAGLWSALAKWRKKAETRGEPCSFESDIIPDELAAQIEWAQKHIGPENAFLWLKQEQSRGVIERRIKRNIRAVLRSFEGDALTAVTGGRAFDYEAFKRKLREVLGPQIEIVTTNQVLQIAAEVGVAFDPAFVNHQAAQWAREYTFDMVEGLTDTTRSVIRDAVSTYIETPDIDQRQLAKQLESAFGKVRAERIAVTETTRAYEQATMQYQQQLDDEGLRMQRVWHTAADDRVCPICAPLDLKPESDWPGAHSDGPPAHVNCRCSTGLSARPTGYWRERHKERQAMLAEEVGAEFAGAEAGGNL